MRKYSYFSRGDKRKERKYIESGENSRKSVAKPSVLERWEEGGDSKLTVFYIKEIILYQ